MNTENKGLKKQTAYGVHRDPLLARRILMALAGMAVAGIAVGFFKRAFFGVDPFQCFCNGINQIVPIGFGTLYMLINAALLIIDFFLDRHYIGISTFINLFLVGYAVEFSENMLAAWFGEPGMALRIVFLLIGIVISCVAAALYYTADLGVSPYDAIPLHIADRKPKLLGKTVSFRIIRIISDLVCVSIGFALRFLPGFGTIITALFMGPLITFFKRTLSDPMLKKKQA